MIKLSKTKLKDNNTSAQRIINSGNDKIQAIALPIKQRPNKGNIHFIVNLNPKRLSIIFWVDNYKKVLGCKGGSESGG